MRNIKRYSFFITILIIHEILAIFIQNVLYPIHFAQENFLFADLMGNRLFLPSAALFLLEAVNLILIWLISKQLFNKFSLLPVLIYGLIPWGSYLLAAGSFYIYLLFLLLDITYGLLLINSKRLLAPFLVIGGIVLGIYSSLLLLLILPIILTLAVILKVIPFNNIKKVFLVSVIFAVPLLILIYNNQPALKNILNNEVKIFSDPGLLNMVNSYQGEASQANLGKFAKISENRYVFFTEYIFLKYLKQLVPSTYFTQQEKLLNFSFSPPIYFGFLIPFAFGLYRILKSSSLRKALFLSTLLVIPSVLAKSMVDLNRLFIFMPVIILVSTFGLILLFEQKKKKKIAIFLAITIFLIILQALVTISDIQLREKDRYIKYFGQNYEIGKQ